LHHRHDGDNLFETPQCHGVIQGQGSYVADLGAGYSECLGLSRSHRDDIGSELTEFLQNESVYALTDRCKKHHRRNTNRDPQSGQERSATVGGDCTGSETRQI
jgi:hypothetical protein